MRDGSTTALPLVGIMAKAPRPGHAKTRLARSLPPEVAADLYRHFLLDTIEVVRRVPSTTATLLCPPGDAGELTVLCLGLPVLEQPVPGLMPGLAFGLDGGLAAGHPAVVLINADSPTLPPARIVDALAALRDHEVVLGPTADGGYYLIAATVPCATLLLDVPYSSGETIFQDTLARARHLGLRIGVVDPWFDVDQPAELGRLALALQEAPLATAAHTRRALVSHEVALAGLLSPQTEG